MALQTLYEDDLRSADPIGQLYSHVKDLVAHGYEREHAVSDLESLYMRMRNEGREVDADVVADVLDCLTDFCGPGLAI